MGKFKSYCNKDCTSCSSIFFISSANRYCYDDKFGLSPVKKQMRYKSMGATNIVATGIIDNPDYEVGQYAVWEGNFNYDIFMEHGDRYYYWYCDFLFRNYYGAWNTIVMMMFVKKMIGYKYRGKWNDNK